MVTFEIVKFDKKTLTQESTGLTSGLIHSVWRIASTLNRERNGCVYTIERKDA